MKPKKLKQVFVNFISLVAKGANRKKIIYKANLPPSSQTVIPFDRQISIKKYDSDKNLVYGIVYSPDEVDSQMDYADTVTIEAMAYNFMKTGKAPNVDFQHNYKPGCGFVAESWLVKKGDPVFPNEKIGSWAVVIKIEDHQIWQDIKSNRITGLSMAGLAEYEDISTSADSVKENAEQNPLNTNECQTDDSNFQSVLYKIDNLAKMLDEFGARISSIENTTIKSMQHEVIKSNPSSLIWL